MMANPQGKAGLALHAGSSKSNAIAWKEVIQDVRDASD